MVAECLGSYASMGRNRTGSNLAVHFDFFFLFFSLSNFLSVDRSHLRWITFASCDIDKSSHIYT